VLDLRTNPGGALDQAIKVSNRFLPRGDLIVSTHGRVQNSDQEYRATERSDYLRIPMITLVNRSSASASEIVSGALQDHDRSLIVGETTFGKALVQSVYRVNQNAGAAITTARYYTPSGRLIQRPWDGTFDEYLTYTLREQDANRAHKPEDMKYTDGGRKVYSGGGVEPDRRFDGPVMGFNPNKLGRALYARNIFDSFAQRFSRKGDTRIAAAANARELAQDFAVTDTMVAEFKEHVTKTGIEIDSDLFGIAVASENLAKVDPQMQFALGFFSEAEQLLTLGRRNQTSRVAQR
jgi:carboxyl-terminal processing protease